MAETDEFNYSSPMSESKEWQKPHYEFLPIGQQWSKSNRFTLGTSKRLSLNEVSTVTIASIYKEGYSCQEIIIPRVPVFIYDCCSSINLSFNDKSEIFRKSGANKRINEFCKLHPELYINGCTFINSKLAENDVAAMLKGYIGQKLKPLLVSGDHILEEMENYLSQNKGIGFYVDANPELGTLLFLIKFLHGICLRDTTKRHTPYNLAVYFAPNIIQDSKMDAEALKHVSNTISLIGKLIANSPQLIILKEPTLVRTRSTSISLDGSKKSESGRRSSSVFGRIMKYMNKEAVKRIQEVERISFEETSHDSRRSRSRSKRNSNASLRGEIIKSSVKLHRRMSLKDSSFCGSIAGSTNSLSPNALSRTSILYNYFDENKKLQQFTNTSLTTLPPGEATVKRVEKGQNINLDHLDELSPEFDDTLQPKQSDFYVKSITPVDETLTPDLSRKMKISGPVEHADGFKVPSFSRMKHYKSIRQNIKAPDDVKTPQESFSNHPDEAFKTPEFPKREYFPFSTSRESKSSFFYLGPDMASIITSSSNAEDLDQRARFTPTSRPSLALLSERKQVSKTIAEIEKRSSAEEGMKEKNILNHYDSSSTSASPRESRSSSSHIKS